MELYPFQETLINKTRVAMREHKSVLMQLPTGGGKTVIAAYIIRASVSKGVRCFFICHRAELITQTAKTMDEWGIEYGYIAAGYDVDGSKKVQICSINTLKNRLDGINPPGLCIWDEAHHSNAKGWAKVKSFFGSSYHVGLSATPSRLDGQGLGEHFTEMIIGPSVKSLIGDRFLSDFEYYAPSSPDLSNVHTLGGDFKKDELDEVVDTPTITGNIISHWKKYAFGKKTLLFAVSVKHSQHIAEQFRNAGIMAIHMDGNTDKTSRRAASIAFASGDIQILCNVALFGEGYDLSAQSGRDCTVEAVIDSSPTRSLAMFLQRAGRALRKKEQKAIILDHAGNWRRHGFPDDGREWTLEGHKVTKKEQDERDIQERQCPECFRVHRPAPRCPNPVCGHEYEVKPRDVDEVEGDLEKIDREAARRIRKEERGSARTLDDLIELGRRKGYKSPERWASYFFTARQAKAKKYAEMSGVEN